MDADIDTSWCPVCECAIMPKRYTVPIDPPPPTLPSASSSTAIKSSQTMRGKNGTIKARAGGLVAGTGRARPALNRANSSTKGKTSQVQPVQQPAPVRTRVVIDQGPTPLYCSDACRERDLEESWPISHPPARDVLDAPRRSSRVQLGAHPSQLNPARASPPPPSPTMPPVPPNSLRNAKSRVRELNLDELTACIQEVDEHSDSSSATGTSYTVSDRSPVDERDLGEGLDFSNDPPPPDIPPLPLHWHRASAPTLPPGTTRNKNDEPRYDGGIMMAAKRLEAFYKSGAMDDEKTREEKKERAERKRKEEERLRKWDYSGELSRSRSNEREKKEAEQTVPAIDPARWTELVYNYNPTASGSSSSSQGVPSTHRRASDSDPSKRVPAPTTPNRTQSALELYAKYPLFVRSSSKTVNGKANKSSASLATSYAPAYGTTVSSSSASLKSSTSSTSGRTPGASALTLPGVDPVLYAGKRLAGPRRAIPKGLEGKLVIPEVLLRPAIPVSSSLPMGSGLAPPPSSGMRRSGSEANVSKKSGRSASRLGAVKEGETEGEDGVWHRPEDGSEDSRSTATRSSVSEQGESRSRRGKKSRSSKSDGRRSIVEVPEPAWSYGKSGPLYDAMPQVPITETRFEEVFVPDLLPGESIKDEDLFIQRDSLYKDYKELSRRAIREIKRTRGQHLGRQGTWIEKEWEVKAIPDRKPLFLFCGAKIKGSKS